MNCRYLTGVCLAAALFAGCKATNTNHAPSATRQPPAPSQRPSTPSPFPATPAPRSTPPVTAAPRVGVPDQIVISATGFTPADITIQTGRAVTFFNSDSNPHRIVSTQAGVFDTGDISAGGSASVTISTTGFTDFHDAAQPSHTGTIRTLP